LGAKSCNLNEIFHGAYDFAPGRHPTPGEQALTTFTRLPAFVRLNLLARIALLALCSLLIVVAVEAMDRLLSVRAASAAIPLAFVLSNALPAVLAFLALFAWTRKTLFSMGLILLLQGLVYAINFIKLFYLGTPVVPRDMLMIEQLFRGGFDIFAHFLPKRPRAYLALLGAAACLIAAYRYEPRITGNGAARTRNLARAVTGLALLLVTGNLLAGGSLFGFIYNRESFANSTYIWSPAQTASEQGLINAFVELQRIPGIDDYKPDAGAAQAFLETEIDCSHDSQQSAERPDIIVIQSESLFDPTVLNGFDHETLPNLRRLAAEGASSGHLHVPTIGGGTIRTEFEMLSGIPLRYFDSIQFPYLQLSMRRFPTLVSVLKTKGYSTTAIHGGDPGFWSRNSAFREMGFDTFESESSFPAEAKIEGAYMADRAMTDKITAQLEQGMEPKFIFAISIEAHGAYDYDLVSHPEQRDHIDVPTTLSLSEKANFKNYLYHIKDADEELGRLADYLAKRERPYVLLFYGDHLPPLLDVYARLGFKNGKNELEQTVPWIMISSRQLGQRRNTEMASWNLAGLLLNQAHVTDAYFATTEAVASTLAPLTAPPGINPSVDPRAASFDQGMRNLAATRLAGKLDLPPRETASDMTCQASVHH
jgi:phosphoglycerol transferase MdoB-like AlkP superfamily enzyme